MPKTSILQEIEFLRSQPLARLVQKEIERQILSGEVQAGARLNELEIARKLGISRAPVRESLRILEQAGLVVSRKNYGVFVRVVSIEEAREIYEARSYIDAGVGQELARRISTRDLSELQGMVERMVEIAGNRKLLDIYRTLLRELALYRRHSLGQPGAMRSSVEEHRGILAAIRARDSDAAGKAMHDHIMASWERLQRAHESVAPTESRRS